MSVLKENGSRGADGPPGKLGIVVTSILDGQVMLNLMEKMT